jgi:hypothetical protein
MNRIVSRMVKRHSQEMPLVASLTLTLLLGDSGCAHTVKPDDMSAEAHRQKAAEESAAARHELALGNTASPPSFSRATPRPPPVPNLGQSPDGAPAGYFYPVDAYNPIVDHATRAGLLQKHAQQHLAAAAELEKFEQSECKSFPPATRAACPLLGPVVSIGDIDFGVRVRFAKGTRIDAVLAHMQCHLAYAEKNGFDKAAAGCPLYIRGVSFRRAQDGQSIDILGPNPKVVADIRRLSRVEAVVIHDDKK